MITACDGKTNYHWEGKVNPYDRSDIKWKEEDLDEVQDLIDQADKILYHNAKFDVRMLSGVGINSRCWDKVEDTMLASHVVCSGERHGLKPLAAKYIGYVNDKERELDLAVQRARAKHPEYDIARKGHKCFPGEGTTKTKWYKMDMWLCMKECLEYGMADVEMTWLLWRIFEEVIEDRGLEEVYANRKKLLPIFYDVEKAGLHMYKDEVDEELARLRAIRRIMNERVRIECKIGQELDLTRESDIKFFLFQVLEIEPSPMFLTEKTKEPSLAKDAIAHYIKQQPDVAPLQHFKAFREAGTKIGYLTSYNKYLCDDNRIRSNYWITGTRETRQATSSPNVQNLDKKLRHLFGPPPGYVQLHYDLVNIEMRIWGYAVGNAEMVELFNNNKSFHMEIAKLLYPDLVKRCEDEGTSFKAEYKDSFYQWIKNGNFSIIYGASEGKADKTYKLEGAYRKVVSKFPEVPVFTRKVINEVLENDLKEGIPYVTCLGGYPLEVNINDLYTTACNYYAQGSAGYIIGLAMDQVAQNPDYIRTGARMVNQVHDSIPIELPIEHLTPEIKESFKRSIEQGGELLLPTCEADLEDVILNPQDIPF